MPVSYLCCHLIWFIAKLVNNQHIKLVWIDEYARDITFLSLLLALAT